MDGWVTAHRAADGDTNGPLTMGYYTRADLPFHYALADAFTVCDAYFCSVLGPSNPNRLYAFTGTIDPGGSFGGPVIDNSETPRYRWTTYPERLQAKGITWRVYQQVNNYDDNPLAWFKQYHTAPAASPLRRHGMAYQHDLIAAFREDVQANRLPQVSWIVPPPNVSEHPPYLPAAGADFIYHFLEALASNAKVWGRSVVFLVYDENDGFFDHVPPPTPPHGTPGEYLHLLPDSAQGISGPIGLGFRVPALVISPWSTGGRVNSHTFDHTSLLRFMERRFGVHEPNISAWRRRTVGDLTSTLRLPDRAARSFPALPDTAAYLKQQTAAMGKPAPQVPRKQKMPKQEV
jgi:phospholipase C